MAIYHFLHKKLLNCRLLRTGSMYQGSHTECFTCVLSRSICCWPLSVACWAKNRQTLDRIVESWAGSTREGCSGLLPVGLWISPRMVTLQPLWTTWFSVNHFHSKINFSYIKAEFPSFQFVPIAARKSLPLSFTEPVISSSKVAGLCRLWIPTLWELCWQLSHSPAWPSKEMASWRICSATFPGVEVGFTSLYFPRILFLLFLKIRLTCTFFQSSGTFLDHCNFLKTAKSDLAMMSASSLSSCKCIPWGPMLLCIFHYYFFNVT